MHTQTNYGNEIPPRNISFPVGLILKPSLPGNATPIAVTMRHTNAISNEHIRCSSHNGGASAGNWHLPHPFTLSHFTSAPNCNSAVPPPPVGIEYSIRAKFLKRHIRILKVHKRHNPGRNNPEPDIRAGHDQKTPEKTSMTETVKCLRWS